MQLRSVCSAHQDPEAATQRIEQIDNPDGRKSAARNLVSQWAQNDRPAALRWVDSQPQEDRPPLYNAVTSSWAQWDPTSALEFARGLRDPDSRDQAILGVAHQIEDIDLIEEAYREVNSADIKSQLGNIIHYKFRASNPDRAAAYQSATSEQPSIRIRASR